MGWGGTEAGMGHPDSPDLLSNVTWRLLWLRSPGKGQTLPREGAREAGCSRDMR